MIDRKFTRSRYVHQHKYHQINKGQFLHGKRIIPVYHKKAIPIVKTIGIIARR